MFLLESHEYIYIILQIAKGVLVTLQYAFFAVFFGFIIAIFFSLLRFKVPIITNIYVSIFRGTPVLVQLTIIHVLSPIDSLFFEGILALSLNSGAYVSEIIRTGIKSIPKGQFEAASSLKIPKYLMWRDIICPQIFKNIIPSLVNECTNMLKETAIISFFGVRDIMYRVEQIKAEKYILIEPLMIAATYYYLIVITLNFISKKIEKSYDYN